jgi:hypothetical protein
MTPFAASCARDEHLTEMSWIQAGQKYYFTSLLVLLCHKCSNGGMKTIPDSFWGRRWICGPRRVWRRVLSGMSSI